MITSQTGSHALYQFVEITGVVTRLVANFEYGRSRYDDIGAYFAVNLQ